MNFIFSKSAVFRKWFKNVRIDAFRYYFSLKYLMSLLSIRALKKRSSNLDFVLF